MSLLHRVSSNESSTTSVNGELGSHGRKLSFNPIGEWIPPAAVQQPIAAYEVSKWRRLIQVITAVIYCLFAAGIIFGYAAIKPVLIREGVYRDQCTVEELQDNVEVCYGQELRLNFMFTTAAVITNVSALPIGTILDRYGPRVCGFISSLSLAVGCLFLAFAYQMKGQLDGYIAGYLFLAIGGPFVFISSFHLSNAFPQNSGLILAVITGAFDASSAIFLFYRIIYTASGGSFWPKKFFLAYLVVPAFILVVQLFVMPSKSYKTVGELLATTATDTHGEQALGTSIRDHQENVPSEVTTLLGKDDAADRRKNEEGKQAISGVYGALQGQSAVQQIQSPFWILISIFSLIQMCRINYFVATVRPQYAYLLSSREKAIQVNSFFDVALPLGGVISVPFIGLLLDNLPTAFVLGILVVFALIIGILGILPYMWAAYLNVVLFCLYRPLYYTAISDYCAKVFGFETFGKVYGLIICIAGLFNFAQSGLDALTHRSFQNDPRPINIILLCVGFAVGAILVTYVTYKARYLDRQRLEAEAEGARISLIPGADERVHEDRHPVNVHADGSADGHQPH